jgi:hypothetical protein
VTSELNGTEERKNIFIGNSVFIENLLKSADAVCSNDTPVGRSNLEALCSILFGV